MQKQTTRSEFLTDEEKEFSQASPILCLYYELVSKAREIKKNQQLNNSQIETN